jgi:hypothetical protein
MSEAQNIEYNNNMTKEELLEHYPKSLFLNSRAKATIFGRFSVKIFTTKKI